jgi:inner membrane protein
MQARNHVPFAMSAWWAYCLITGQPIAVHGTMAAAIGGLLPDLDHPNSILGRKLPFISQPLAAMFGHRGMTHSLLAMVLMVGILLFVTTLYPLAGLAGIIAPLAVGYLSHLLGDSMTPSGIPLFWPHRKTYSFNLFKTWSWQETAFVGTLTIALVVLGGVAEMVIQDFLNRFHHLASL